MELWFIYALISILGSGSSSFLLKIAAEHKHDANKVTEVSFLVSIPIILLFWLYQGASTIEWFTIMLIGGAGGVIYAIVYLLRIKALGYMDTSLYFPIYKTLGPIFVLIIGLFYFNDKLTSFDYWGIGLGILVPLMLISKVESTRQRNLPQGLLLLVAAAILAALAFALSKVGIDTQADIWLFILFQSLFGFLFGICFDLYKTIREQSAFFEPWLQLKKSTVLIASAIGLIDIVTVFFILKALESGVVSVVYTVGSFYILIPIILSVIFYNEHMSLRKALAIGLSILSVIFFQI